jgi:hypothetical protein
MFRATKDPSSGETTVLLRHLVLVWFVYQSSTHSNKYQVSQKHSCFSWWWVHSRPKHVEIDKYTKNKLCTKLVLYTNIFDTYGLTHNSLFCDRLLSGKWFRHRVWVIIRALYNNMNMCWNVEGGDLISYLMVFSFCIRSCSCVMAWWWLLLGVETSCQVINDRRRVCCV